MFFYYLVIVGSKITGWIPFPKILELCKKQTASFRFRSFVIVSFSYECFQCIYVYLNSLNIQNKATAINQWNKSFQIIQIIDFSAQDYDRLIVSLITSTVVGLTNFSDRSLLEKNLKIILITRALCQNMVEILTFTGCRWCIKIHIVW